MISNLLSNDINYLNVFISQKAFDDARKEIQRYYETTLSRRIAAYTAGKEYISQPDLTFG